MVLCIVLRTFRCLVLCFGYVDSRVKVVALRQELAKMQAIAERAQSTWDKFRKERDFHRMHHKRVVQVTKLLSSNA